MITATICVIAAIRTSIACMLPETGRRSTPGTIKARSVMRIIYLFRRLAIDETGIPVTTKLFSALDLNSGIFTTVLSKSLIAKLCKC